MTGTCQIQSMWRQPVSGWVGFGCLVPVLYLFIEDDNPAQQKHR
jgi:hypothetical protein